MLTAENSVKMKARLMDLPYPNHYIHVNLDAPQDKAFEAEDLSPANISIRLLPSGKVVRSTTIDPARTFVMPGFGRKALQIVLTESDETRPAPGDTLVEVIFRILHFEGVGPREQVECSGPILYPAKPQRQEV